MLKLPAWRLDPASYPHHVVIQTRFQDLDVMGHINNAAYAALFESARVRFNQSLGLAGWKGHRWLVARVEINYLAEGHFPTDLDIATGIGPIGTRSWQIFSTAFQHAEPIATCDVVLVMERQSGVDGLSPAFRDGLAKSQIAAAL